MEQDKINPVFWHFGFRKHEKEIAMTRAERIESINELSWRHREIELPVNPNFEQRHKYTSC